MAKFTSDPVRTDPTPLHKAQTYGTQTCKGKLSERIAAPKFSPINHDSEDNRPEARPEAHSEAHPKEIGKHLAADTTIHYGGSYPYIQQPVVSHQEPTFFPLQKQPAPAVNLTPVSPERRIFDKGEFTKRRIFDRRKFADSRVYRGLSAELPRLRYIFNLFLATRAVLVLIGLVSYAALPKGYGKQMTWSNQPWLDMWGVWDSLWYMDIAQNGYSVATKLADYPDQTNFPFFPLYPLLMRFIGYFTGGPFIAGLVISNVCLLVSCYIFYKLVEPEWGRAIARRSIKYLFLFPVSFILSGVFTESLYLCLSLLCFYLAKERKWWLAGLCGALLSATRTLGILIAIPLFVEYISGYRFKPSDIRLASARSASTPLVSTGSASARLANFRLNSLFVALIPLGLLAFSYYNYRATGDFLFFKTNQAAWDRAVMNPLIAFMQALSQGLSEPSFKKLLECAFFVGAFGLLSAFYKKVGLSYWLLGMYSIWIPLSAGVASMPRFTLPIFPLFLALALLSQKHQWNLWLTVGLGALQGALMVFWCTGQGLVI